MSEVQAVLDWLAKASPIATPVLIYGLYRYLRYLRSIGFMWQVYKASGFKESALSTAADAVRKVQEADRPAFRWSTRKCRHDQEEPSGDFSALDGVGQASMRSSPN